MSNLPKGNDMTATQPPTEDTTATSRTEKLDEIGEGQGIIREEGEPDAVYAERIIYELDVCVEELWAVQDSVRELVSEDE
jgi:hypothetical protein